MPKFVPVTPAAFTDKHWTPPSDYRFTAKDTICPLVLHELPKAHLSLPIAIAYINKQPVPVAVQGIQPQTNLLIDQKGQWIGRYLPASYRSYPFMLGQTKEGQPILFFDQDSGLLAEDTGKRFFEDDGKFSEPVTAMLKLLLTLQQQRKQTETICTLLHDKQLIQPWTIKPDTDTDPVSLKGLFRIDEQALNGLDKDSFEEIRQSGALPLIYCQLLSMQHLQALITAAAQQNKQVVEAPDIDKLFGEKNDQLFKF